MNYEDMSDFDINCEVAMAVDPQLGYADEDSVTDAGNGAANFRLCDPIGNDHDAGTYDYCGSWGEAGVIIHTNKIGIDWACGDDWEARISNQGQPGALVKFKARHRNPRRAAMIAFLMLQEAKR